jgi:hypothetical protein
MAAAKTVRQRPSLEKTLSETACRFRPLDYTSQPRADPLEHGSCEETNRLWRSVRYAAGIGDFHASHSRNAAPPVQCLEEHGCAMTRLSPHAAEEERAQRPGPTSRPRHPPLMRWRRSWCY